MKNWQIKLICPCTPDKPIDLVKSSFGVFYQCTQPGCPNYFSSDIRFRLEEKLEQYLQEHDDAQGFEYRFRIKESQMRARFVREDIITDQHSCIVIEVTNLTKMPQYA